jgi:hypothetical protein
MPGRIWCRVDLQRAADRAIVLRRAAGRPARSLEGLEAGAARCARQPGTVGPSSYDAQLAIRCDPSKASKRAQQDARDSREIRRLFSESGGRYGARKVWHALRREGYDIARLTRWKG